MRTHKLGTAALAFCLFGIGGCMASGEQQDDGGSPMQDSGTDGTGSTAVDIGGGPYSIIYAGTAVGIDQRKATQATLTSGLLKTYTFSAMEAPDRGTNQVVDSGGEGPVAWGRWAGGMTSGTFYGNTFTFPTNGGFHYAIGKPTVTIPASGGGTWVLDGKTSATVSDGSLAAGTISGTIGVAFSGATTHVGVSLSLDVPGDATYPVESQGGSANPSTSQIKIFSENFFRHDDANPIRLTAGGACTAAGTNCIAAVTGFIAGDNADRVAIVVHVYKGTGGAAKTVSGAIVFKKQ